MGSIEDGGGGARADAAEEEGPVVDRKKRDPSHPAEDRRDPVILLCHPNGGGRDAQPPPPLSSSSPSSRCAALWTETRLFLELAAGTTLMYLGVAALPLMTASCVGRRFGPVCLTAFSLANLTGNLCTQTLVMGLLGAIDTLGPQAVGTGRLPEVGLLAVRGFAVTMTVLIPINAALVVGLEPLLMAVGEDPAAARLAHRWYRIYAVSLPFSVLYGSLCKFLTVQNITAPIAAISVGLTLAIGPVLELSAATWGFLGTAAAFVGFWVAASGLLLAYVCWKRPHDPRTWPRESLRRRRGGGGRKPEEPSPTRVLWKATVQRTALREFVVLGLGGVVAQCEWVFWEALGLVVGKLGVPAMTAHAIPTQIVFSVSTLQVSCGIALAVRMGISLPTSVPRARAIAIGVVAATAAFSWIASTVLYDRRSVLIRLFTDASGGTADDDDDDDYDASSEQVFFLAESIWPEVSVLNFNCNMFLILAGVSSGLGKQWALGTINVVFLWILGMPVIYCKAIAGRHDDDDIISSSSSLKTVWLWMNLAYAGINLSLLWFLFFRTDWYEVQAAVLEEGTNNDEAEAAAAAGSKRASDSIAAVTNGGDDGEESSMTTTHEADERTGLLLRAPSPRHRD